MKKLIYEICKERDIKITPIGDGYILRLTKGAFVKHIYGAYWDINPAASDKIACDKHACSTILASEGIPVIPNEIVFNPIRRPGYNDETGMWKKILNYYHTNNNCIVVKPNQGSQGRDVYLCDTITSLETAVSAVFETHPDAAISPYMDIKTEYRVFFLYGRAMFVYGKKAVESWKHNLSMGAKAYELKNEKRANEIKMLACRAAKCIKMNFATVDIVELKNGKLMIMEINAGVQSKLLLEQLPHLKPILKSIYTEAILSTLRIEHKRPSS